MKTMPAFILLILLALTYSSCKDCKGDNEMSGIVVGEINDFCPVQGAVILNSVADGDSILDENLCAYKDINFAYYTVLGYGTTGTCNSRMERVVLKDDVEKKYIYKLTMYSCKCWHKNAEVFSNLVLVPKLPTDYTVEFLYREE